MDEALAIARQIAESLEAAHEQGIVHRDLKPANVKVRDDGTVKVLDFGLAKALEPASAPRSISPSSMTLSPTITTPAMTQVGFILGSAAYMSPEQARGRAVDRRADIWAFGCVLFEMLTGKRAFEADDVSLTLARVLERDVDLIALPATVPPRVRQVIGVCLRKDPRQRLQAMGDVRLALEGVFETPAAVPDDRARRHSSSTVAARRAIRGDHGRRCGGDRVPRSSSRSVATGHAVSDPCAGWIDAAARHAGHLARRADDRLHGGRLARCLAASRAPDRPHRDSRASGTENAIHPFWFADGRSLAFAAVPDNYLKSIDVDAGSARTLFNVTGPWHGTSNQDDIVLFPGGGGISRWANGQKPALELPRQKGENSGAAFRSFSPMGSGS